MKTVKELAWLGGLLEGEGCFRMLKAGYPIVQLQMTDADTVNRASALFGTKTHNSKRTKMPGREHYKPIFQCEVNGRKAVAWMMTLYQFLGERRQKKIREILTEWAAKPGYTKASRGQRTRARCHPDKPNEGDGLCQTCYMRQYRAHGRQGMRTGAWAT